MTVSESTALTNLVIEFSVKTGGAAPAIDSKLQRVSESPQYGIQYHKPARMNTTHTW